MSNSRTPVTTRPKGAPGPGSDRRPTVTRFDSRRRPGGAHSGRPGARLAMAVAAVFAICAAILWTVFASPFMAASNVVVVGNHSLTSAQIAQAARVPIGRPLARLDLESVVSRIDAIPAVLSVVVSRSYPHTVRIAVVERVPVAAVRSPNGDWHLVDAGGVSFDTSAQVPAGMPVITGTAAIPGVGRALLEACAAVSAALPRSLRQAVTTVAAASPFAVTLHLSTGIAIRWGDARDSAFKAQVLTALMKHRASVYDVSVPDQPTTSG